MKFITIEHKDGEFTIPLDTVRYIGKHKYECCIKYSYENGDVYGSAELTEDQYNKLLKQLNNIDKPRIINHDLDRLKELSSTLTPEQVEQLIDKVKGMIL